MTYVYVSSDVESQKPEKTDAIGKFHLNVVNISFVAISLVIAVCLQSMMNVKKSVSSIQKCVGPMRNDCCKKQNCFFLLEPPASEDHQTILACS
jgi:hypothetical protein